MDLLASVSLCDCEFVCCECVLVCLCVGEFVCLCETVSVYRREL